jgi:dihydrofolate reductase
MRKLIVSMNLSLDGLMSGPEGQLDWHMETWDEGMSEQWLTQLEYSDTLLLGRVTYEAMASYWTMNPLKQNFPRRDLAIADRMNSHRKIVFSGSSPAFMWNNTLFVHGNLKREVIQLKKKKGKEILLFGSNTLASSIIHGGLADEYRLWIHPVILGKGNPLFRNLKTKLNFRLSDSRVFDSGVLFLNYRAAR